MSITPLQIYLVLQADTIINTFQVLTVISMVALLILGIFALVCDGDDIAKITKCMKILFIPILFCGTASALLPSTKTLAAMIVIPAIADSSVIQKDAPEIYKLAVDRLKSSLQPEVEKP